MKTNNSFENEFNPTADNDAKSVPGPSMSNANRWQDKCRDNKYATKKKHCLDKEWIQNRQFHGKTRKSGKDDESANEYTEGQGSTSQQPQTMQTLPSAITLPNSYCNSIYPFSVETNLRQDAMMNSYGFYRTSVCAFNPMDKLNIPSSNMASNSLPTSTGRDMIFNTSTNMMNMPPGALPMYGMMGGIGNCCSYPMMSRQENVPVKQVITLHKSVLYPPEPNATPPMLRKKPPGCKTISVEGLPEKISEEIIREVFAGCGEILTVIMSKNSCQVLFTLEAYVEKALYLSGYRIKIENKDDAAFSGRLHVDYAIAHDDEYECSKHAMQPEAHDREQQVFHSPTPPPVDHYSEHQATLIADKIRSEVEFKNAVQVLITWLKRGECTKENADTFYSMIQSTNNHVWRLLNDITQYRGELDETKDMLRQKKFDIYVQSSDIEKVFEAVRLQKYGDHFTKAQQKNIELWKKQIRDLKKANFAELMDEGEVSYREEHNGPINNQPVVNEELSSLREQFDDLRNQLNAAQQEAIYVKLEEKERINAIRQDFLIVSKNLLESQNQVIELHKCLSQSTNLEKNDNLQKNETTFGSDLQGSVVNCTNCNSDTGNLMISQREVCLVAATVGFLNILPHGASINYICSYLAQFDPGVNIKDMENLMKKFPSLFKEESIGATEKKWAFVGFQSF